MAAELSTDSADSVPFSEQATAIAANPDGAEFPEGSEEHIKKCLQDANELKLEATGYFKAQDWSQALVTYTSALGRLPKRIQEPKPYDGSSPDVEASSDEVGDRDEDEKNEETSKAKPEPTPPTYVELECAKTRAILNANIGACHVKLEEYKEAVKACSEALVDDPSYIKALQRRASCNEKIGSWSALAGAQDDYNTLLKLLPPDSPQIGPTKRALTSLKPRVEEAQKRETAEVLEKLKGVGNSVLGNFGLSTDNFKFEPNGQGGYSMNFVR